MMRTIEAAMGQSIRAFPITIGVFVSVLDGLGIHMEEVRVEIDHDQMTVGDVLKLCGVNLDSHSLMVGPIVFVDDGLIVPALSFLPEGGLAHY